MKQLLKQKMAARSQMAIGLANARGVAQKSAWAKWITKNELEIRQLRNACELLEAM